MFCLLFLTSFNVEKNCKESYIHDTYGYKILFYMGKNKQFQSQEAQTIARTTKELEILADAIRDVEDKIGRATGIEKQQLEVKKADLEIQQSINETRRNHATNAFQLKYNSSLSADEISANADAVAQGKEASDKFTKGVQTFNRGARLIVDAAAKLASISYDAEYEAISARTDILMANIEALTEKAMGAADLQAKAYTSAITNSLLGITDGINEAAYASANSLIDLSAQSKIFDLEKERIDLENKNTKQLRTEQRDATLSNLYTKQTEAYGAVAPEIGRNTAHAFNDVEALGASAGDAPGVIGDMVADLGQATLAATSTMIQSENKLIVQRYENEKKLTEAALKAQQGVEKKWIEAGANVEKAWLQFAQKIEGGLVKSEAAANALGVSMGFAGTQLDTFKKTMFDSQVAVAKWGKKLEDMQKLQSSYQDNSGRNIQFSTNDFETSFALDKITGQDGLSSQIASAMELFNHGIADSNELAFDMFKKVSKIGLNGTKFLKEVPKYLKLAERYQFKGGIKGMKEMAKWAQNVRFNMDNFSSILNQMHEGGLEGAITKGAQLQVLGGKFAMGADPLAMLWESYNDPAGYAKRLNGMAEGMGSFDSRTGEVNFNMMEQMALEAMAKATGMDVTDLMNQQRQRIKGERMTRELNNGVKWTDDEKSLITNKAQLVNGEWKVTMDNGEQMNVSDLSQEDLNHLMPTDNEEKLVNYVYDIRDMMTQLAGAKQEATSRLERDGFDQWYQEEQTRIQNVVTDFNSRYEEYLSEFKEKMHLATTAQQTMLDLMSAGNQNIDNASAEIKQQGQNIASSLAQVNQLIQDALSEINNRQNEWKPKQGEIAYDNPHATNRLLPYDARWSMPWQNPLSNETKPSSNPKVQAAQQAAKEGDYCTAVQNAYIGRSSILDGTLEANGQSMTVAASKVTPIQDGEIATTAPDDHAIFAKVGGPFDKLFNGIFTKINAVYDSMYGQQTEKPIKELYRIAELQKQKEIQLRPLPDIEMPVRDNGNMNRRYEEKAPVLNNGSIKVEPITLNIKLDGVLGQSKDFMEELTNNPMLIRSMSQMISEAINKNINGGKSTYTGGVSNPRFKGVDF